LFADRPFVDRFIEEIPGDEPIDVIVPLLHSTDLWRENLKSYYQEIPISRLLIGDAGAIDGSPEIALEFPRVEVIDHTHLSTLGASIADLISRVETEIFIYLQSDVFLPNGWLSPMKHGLLKADWVGCPMEIVVLMNYSLDYTGRRPLAGSQMGRTRAFNGVASKIDDDFVYRNEDFVFASLVRENGCTVGSVYDTYHFHQVMRRVTSGEALDVRSIQINVDRDPAEELRVNKSQAFGLIKYCSPSDSEAKKELRGAVNAGLQSSAFTRKELIDFAKSQNPLWLDDIKVLLGLKSSAKRFMSKLVKKYRSI
jgi:hypothetical protein